jgi:hypothetical protein
MMLAMRSKHTSTRAISKTITLHETKSCHTVKRDG